MLNREKRKEKQEVEIKCINDAYRSPPGHVVLLYTEYVYVLRVHHSLIYNQMTGRMIFDSAQWHLVVVQINYGARLSLAGSLLGYWPLELCLPERKPLSRPMSSILVLRRYIFKIH